MFLKIKNRLIALGQITNVLIDKDKKTIAINFNGEGGILYSTKDEDLACTINTPQFEKLVEFFETGEYEGCSTSIDIINPLKP